MRDERDARRDQLRARRLDLDVRRPSGLREPQCDDRRQAARDPRARPERPRFGNRRPTTWALRADTRRPSSAVAETPSATPSVSGDRSSRRCATTPPRDRAYRHRCSNAFSSSAVSRAHSSMKFGRETEIGCLPGLSGGTKRRIVRQRRIAAHAVVVLHAALGRQAVVVPAHRIEHGLAAHALEARDDIGVRVREHVADVERPADRRRRCIDRIDLIARTITGLEAVGAVRFPFRGPLRLEAF